MVFKIIVGLLMSVIIYSAFMGSIPQAKLGEASRIFFFHVPAAWVAVVAYLVSMIYSILYLRKKDLSYDCRAANSAQLGLIFTILATVSGSVFAKAAWGSYWNWDPRETSIFLLLLIYGAYLALRSAVSIPERKATLSAVYSILAFVTVPFLVFVVPRVFESLHPPDSIVDKSGKIQMTLPVAWKFFASLFCFTFLFFWIFSLQNRLAKLKK